MREIAHGVRELDGQEIIDWLRGSSAVTFRYKANKPGMWIMFFLGVLVFVVSGVLVYRTGLTLPIQKFAFSMLLVFGIWCWYKPIRWSIFSVRNYVALAPSQMLIGSGKKAKLIELSRITPETVDLEAMQKSRYTSVLPVRIADFRADVFMVGLYVHLEEVERFIAELLPLIAPDSPDSPVEVVEE